MRRRLEPALRRLWRGESGTWERLGSAVLLPAELAYRAAVALRNQAYDRGWLSSEAPPVPVVSVGNLLAGGTGKTPVAAWIARILADAGRAPALVTRGYGQDEVELHRRWNPDVPVLADPDRASAAAGAATAGRRSVVLDDGFQHRALGRSLDLVLVPVEDAGPVRLLPRGPYREPESALRRADFAVLVRRVAGGDAVRAAENRLRERFPELPLARLGLAPGGWTTAGGAETDPPTGPLLAVTGIARPALFRTLVERDRGSDVELMEFPDHHAFSTRDLREVARRARGRTVVTTEKDAVRLAEDRGRLESLRVLRLRVEPERGGERLRRAVLAAVREEETPERGPRPSSGPGGGRTSSAGAARLGSPDADRSGSGPRIR